MESEFSGNMNIYICTYFVLNTYRVSWYSVKQFHRSCADHNKLYITLYSKYEQNSKFRWTEILKLMTLSLVIHNHVHIYTVSLIHVPTKCLKILWGVKWAMTNCSLHYSKHSHRTDGLADWLTSQTNASGIFKFIPFILIC